MGDQSNTTYLIVTLIVDFIHGIVLIWKITVDTFDSHMVANGNALHCSDCAHHLISCCVEQQHNKELLIDENI